MHSGFLCILGLRMDSRYTHSWRWERGPEHWAVLSANMFIDLVTVCRELWGMRACVSLCCVCACVSVWTWVCTRVCRACDFMSAICLCFFFLCVYVCLWFSVWLTAQMRTRQGLQTVYRPLQRFLALSNRPKQHEHGILITTLNARMGGSMHYASLPCFFSLWNGFVKLNFPLKRPLLCLPAIRLQKCKHANTPKSLANYHVIKWRKQITLMAISISTLQIPHHSINKLLSTLIFKFTRETLFGLMAFFLQFAICTVGNQNICWKYTWLMKHSCMHIRPWK